MIRTRLHTRRRRARRASPGPRPGRWAGVVWLTAGPLLGACAAEAPAVALLVEELPSPAGEGSGQPFLSSLGDTILMSWLEPGEGGGHDLRFARLADRTWGEPGVIAKGDDLLVNWADFPSVTAGTGGDLWAHWLVRGDAAPHDYGIRVARSADGGATWSEPRVLHEDESPTQHGFVSALASGSAMGFLWLDGRRFVPASAGGPLAEEMALYFRTVAPGGGAGAETLVDARVCDCCQTDMALTVRGPVAAYRDRSEGEVRDIRVRRFRDGEWGLGTIVHQDGWETAACPVNGPAVAAHGDDVAVAWFTAAGGLPRVRLAFSDDAAGTFADPVGVDGGNPAGRVDLAMLADGSALVTWLERTGDDRSEVLARRVDRTGRASDAVSVSVLAGRRAGGFPRVAAAGNGDVAVAWTDVTELRPRVRVARIDLENPTGGTK